MDELTLEIDTLYVKNTTQPQSILNWIYRKKKNLPSCFLIHSSFKLWTSSLVHDPNFSSVTLLALYSSVFLYNSEHVL